MIQVAITSFGVDGEWLAFTGTAPSQAWLANPNREVAGARAGPPPRDGTREVPQRDPNPNPLHACCTMPGAAGSTINQEKAARRSQKGEAAGCRPRADRRNTA